MLFADVLHLKNGGSMEGRVVEEGEDSVVFESEGAAVKFLRSEIDRIEKMNWSPSFKIAVPRRENSAPREYW